MTEIYFDNVGAMGIIKDIPAHELPPEAWSNGQNIRVHNGKVEKFKGHLLTYASSTASNSIVTTPYFAMPVPTGAAYYWLYAGLSTIGATDGDVHTAISTVSYSAQETQLWNGGVIGGIAVLTNGVNVPLQWGDSSAGPSMTKKVKPLEAWSSTSSVTCRFMRPFKNYLVAGDITEGGVRQPRLVWWSHAADTGNVPQSWDYTDPSKDAGRNELAETPDFLIDCLPLHDVNIVYKEHSTWGMQYIGGNFVFRFYRILPDIGMLARNCASTFLGRNHAVMGVNDIYSHDGQQMQSLFTAKMKDWFYNQIDSAAYIRSFTVTNYFKNEVWFCFPQSGSTYPNLALIWNYKDNTTSIRELPETPHIAIGIVDPNVNSSWGSDSGTWLSDTSYWDQQSYNPTLLSLLMVSAAGNKLYHVDSGETFNGVAMTSYVERTGIPLGKVGADGRMRADLQTYKHVRAIYPRIEGANGVTVSCYVGTQQIYNGTTTWNGPYTYTIGTTRKIDVRVTGRIIGLKFQSTGTDTWALTGYGIDYEMAGTR